MFFDAKEWTEIQFSILPCEAKNEQEIPAGDAFAWNEWRKKKCKNEKSSDDLYEICREWFFVKDLPILFDKPFTSSWEITSLDNDEHRTVFRVSSMKWETLCLLSRVILTNISDVCKHPTQIESNKQKLQDVVACSSRAIEELKEWWEPGNRHQWKTTDTSETEPMEISFHFYEVFRSTGELLFMLYCLSSASTEEVCEKNFNELLMSLIKKAEAIKQFEHTPDELDAFVNSVYLAVVVGVSEAVIRSAFKMRVLPEGFISWRHVCEWKQRTIEVRKQCNNLTAADDEELEELERIEKGNLVENRCGPLNPKPFQFQIEFKFPFE
jgi:hypothetical protein